ncbi:MAG: hypothetical protein RJQ09_06175 [Cyclobacteriaceae bacterium]
MFGLFKKKKKEKPLPPIVDMDQNPLKVGDMVMSHRYDLGLCQVIENETGIAYQAIESGKVEPWTRMIDASTEFQKVKKVDGESDQPQDEADRP